MDCYDPCDCRNWHRGCRGGENRRPLRGSLSVKSHWVRENGDDQDRKLFLVPPGRPREMRFVVRTMQEIEMRATVLP